MSQHKVQLLRKMQRAENARRHAAPQSPGQAPQQPQHQENGAIPRAQPAQLIAARANAPLFEISAGTGTATVTFTLLPGDFCPNVEIRKDDGMGNPGAFVTNMQFLNENNGTETWTAGPNDFPPNEPVTGTIYHAVVAVVTYDEMSDSDTA